MGNPALKERLPRRWQLSPLQVGIQQPVGMVRLPPDLRADNPNHRPFGSKPPLSPAGSPCKQGRRYAADHPAPPALINAL